jgi:hypothetical protein
LMEYASPALRQGCPFQPPSPLSSRSEADLSRPAPARRAVEGSAVSLGSSTLYRQNREGALLVSTGFPHGDEVK